MNVKQVSTTATGNHKRSKELHDYYWGTSEIATHMRAYPQVNWRYFVQERSGLGGTSELDFTNSTTWPIQVIGRQEAQEALDYGPGYGFDRVPIDEKLPTFYDSLHYWLDSIF